MYWASKRMTTRPEVIAYCLLGLFEVKMPLLCKEGAEKAFNRLQEEIMKDSDGQSLFAWIQPSTDRTTMRGFLADSPAIIPVRDWGKSNPYSMTNTGLRITLSTAPSEMHEFLSAHSQGRLRIVILDCITKDGSMQLVALHLY
ncbi:hypothetical protein BKA66DRAFT_179676 [Pyrenochaeta sp. MPI-SDFR-AT-0127]|nr:hypothetical protein BKA66DRAFT_179676 [Pyrenochaeta sp. MPI-SDFR-AT-0127]